MEWVKQKGKQAKYQTIIFCQLWFETMMIKFNHIISYQHQLQSMAMGSSMFSTFCVKSVCVKSVHVVVIKITKQLFNF